MSGSNVLAKSDKEFEVPSIPPESNEGDTPAVGTPLERTSSLQPPSLGLPPPDSPRSAASFGRMSFSSMMGGLSALSLSRTNTNTSVNSVSSPPEEKETRGRSITKGIKLYRTSSAASDSRVESSGNGSRARSQSPFTFMRFRHRDPSPAPQPLPLALSESEQAVSLPAHVPCNAYTDEQDHDSGDETVGEGTETEDDGWSDDESFDPVTERNTEKNALIAPADGEICLGMEGDADADVEPDPTGEGVNVIVPPEPYFPSINDGPHASSGRGKRTPKRRKSTKHHVPLKLTTSRAVFERDRCTIIITQGDPESKLEGRKRRTYVVASDLSEESRYAMEWGIGTVLRDGDEMLIVTIVENESRVDPPSSGTTDRTVRLRSQQERQGLAYILVRQATSLLQRTKLNVTVYCQAWHAKNARHMLLDVVDYNEPTMLIVGSRGLGQLKGILLGSTSHYLIQKCSVPVMVARRRLRRPPRRSAHLAKQRTHVSLAEAGIDRVAPKVGNDIKALRGEMERGDALRAKEIVSAGIEEVEEPEGEGEIVSSVKIAE